MLYVLASTRIRTPAAIRYRKSNCAQEIVPGPNPQSVAAAARVNARPLVDLSEDPFVNTSFTACWSKDPKFARIIRVGGTPELPTLPEWKSNLRESARTSDWKERVKRGEIVVNPMLRSRLVIRDAYKVVPGKPTIGSRGAYVITELEDLVTKSCGNDVVSRGDWWERVSTVGSPELRNNNSSTAELIWTMTNDPSSLEPMFGKTMSDARTRTIHQLLVAALDSLERDSSVTTKVIADTRSGTYDLLTDIAEFKSTVQTLMSCALRILRFYLDTKKKIASLGRPPKAKKALDAFVTKSNNQWLEFRYGIAPVIMSANSAIDWLNTRNHEYAKFRGLTTQTAVLTAGNLSVEVPVIIDRAFGKVRVDGATGGLKLNPLRTALELVPMSLLLNWVCNIGDVLSACYPASSAKQEVYTVSRQVPPGVYQATLDGESISIEFDYYRNIVINPYDHIKLQAEFNMNWQRFIDAFAFAYGPLKKKLLTKSE